MTFFDRLLAGPEGELTLTRDEVDTMGLADSSAITAKIDYEQQTRPGLTVQVRDTPDGGLIFRWRTRS